MALDGKLVLSKRDRMQKPSNYRFNFVSTLVLTLGAAVGVLGAALTASPVLAIAGAAVGLLFAQSPRVAQQWERGVVLRLGRYIGLRGPGIFWVVPFVDKVS